MVMVHSYVSFPEGSDIRVTTATPPHWPTAARFPAAPPGHRRICRALEATETGDVSDVDDELLEKPMKKPT